MRKPRELHNFYKSRQWHIARTVKIQNVNGKCERCGNVGQEVHHKISLTVENVKDALVSLNQDNLELLCRESVITKNMTGSKRNIIHLMKMEILWVK